MTTKDKLLGNVDMTKFELLKSVAPDVAAKACLFRDAILESPSLLKQDWLRQKGWVAVPLRQQCCGMMAMERLAKALADAHVAELLLIYPTDDSVDCNCMAFPATLEGLMEAATAGAHEAASIGALNYFITNLGEPVFVYHYTVDDFNLLAGQRHFVEAALGASIKSGHHDWHEYASHPGWSEAEKDVYCEIERWYRE
jgi:hypothetical protein